MRKAKPPKMKCDACREPAGTVYPAFVCKECAEKFAAARGKPLAAPIKRRRKAVKK